MTDHSTPYDWATEEPWVDEFAIVPDPVHTQRPKPWVPPLTAFEQYFQPVVAVL